MVLPQPDSPTIPRVRPAANKSSLRRPPLTTPQRVKIAGGRSCVQDYITDLSRHVPPLNNESRGLRTGERLLSVSALSPRHCSHVAFKR